MAALSSCVYHASKRQQGERGAHNWDNEIGWPEKNVGNLRHCLSHIYTIKTWYTLFFRTLIRWVKTTIFIFGYGGFRTTMYKFAYLLLRKYCCLPFRKIFDNWLAIQENDLVGTTMSQTCRKSVNKRNSHLTKSPFGVKFSFYISSKSRISSNSQAGQSKDY